MNIMLEKLAFFTAMISSMTSLDCFLSDKLWAYFWVHDMFSRIFRILQIYKFFHQYFSVEKEDKFLIGLWVLSIWENLLFQLRNICENFCRFVVFGKFVKTCRKLNNRLIICQTKSSLKKSWRKSLLWKMPIFLTSYSWITYDLVFQHDSAIFWRWKMLRLTKNYNYNHA